MAAMPLLDKDDLVYLRVPLCVFVSKALPGNLFFGPGYYPD
mgnify:FL=1